MDENKFLSSNPLKAYKTAFHLSNYVWDIVIGWDHFAPNTIGCQFVNAVDSISANLAEGFGRYHKKDNAHTENDGIRLLPSPNRRGVTSTGNMLSFSSNCPQESHIPKIIFHNTQYERKTKLNFTAIALALLKNPWIGTKKRKSAIC